MDEIDATILKELQNNSRIPSADLACMLEISEAEVESRITGLKEAGILRSCTAVIVTGDDNVMVVLSLKVTPEKGLGYDGIAEKISRFPQVESIHLLTGTHDFQVTIHGKTMTEVSRFIAEQIASIDGVRETMTQIIMRTYKEQGVPMSRPGNRDRQLIHF